MCAFQQENDKVLMKALSQYDPAQHEEPKADLLRLLLTYALDMLEAMNCADGLSRTAHQLSILSKLNVGRTIGNYGNESKTYVAKRDLMAPFRTSKKYAFYWKLRKELETQKRFSGKTKSRKQIGFDKAMQLDTILENNNAQFRHEN